MYIYFFLVFLTFLYYQLESHVLFISLYLSFFYWKINKCGLAKEWVGRVGVGKGQQLCSLSAIFLLLKFNLLLH